MPGSIGLGIRLACAAGWQLEDMMGKLPFVIAAADAPAEWQQAASTVCGAVDDSVAINAALASLGSDGGLIQFSPGTFVIAQPINLNLADKVVFQGSNIGGTYIHLATNANCHMFYGDAHSIFYRWTGLHIIGRSAYQSKSVTYPYDMIDGIHLESVAEDTGTNLTVHASDATKFAPDGHTMVAGADVNKVVVIGYSASPAWAAGEYLITANDDTYWTLSPCSSGGVAAPTSPAAVGTAGGVWRLLSTGQGAYDVQVDNCWVQACKGHGYWFREGWGVHLGDRTIGEYNAGDQVRFADRPLARPDYGPEIHSGKYLSFTDNTAAGAGSAAGLGHGVYLGAGNYSASLVGNQLRSDVANRAPLCLFGDAARVAGSGKHSIMGNMFLVTVGQASVHHIQVLACERNRIIGNTFPGVAPAAGNIIGVHIPVSAYACYNIIDDNDFGFSVAGDLPINALQGRQYIGHNNRGYCSKVQGFIDCPHEHGDARTLHLTPATASAQGVQTGLFGSTASVGPTVPAGAVVACTVQPQNANAAAHSWYAYVYRNTIRVTSTEDLDDDDASISTTLSIANDAAARFDLMGNTGTPFSAAVAGDWVRVYNSGGTPIGTYYIEVKVSSGAGVTCYGATPPALTSGDTCKLLKGYKLSVTAEFTNQDRSIEPLVSVNGIDTKHPLDLTTPVV
ncbi:MAG: hypothetical protein NT029_08335 [Armatimonadetes bacterium]|nr:hypothetical protein [Armatimonadota bacterium]